MKELISDNGYGKRIQVFHCNHDELETLKSKLYEMKWKILRIKKAERCSLVCWREEYLE
jgi:hypothetical protein